MTSTLIITEDVKPRTEPELGSTFLQIANAVARRDPRTL